MCVCMCIYIERDVYNSVSLHDIYRLSVFLMTQYCNLWHFTFYLIMAAEFLSLSDGIKTNDFSSRYTDEYNHYIKYKFCIERHFTSEKRIFTITKVYNSIFEKESIRDTVHSIDPLQSLITRSERACYRLISHM